MEQPTASKIRGTVRHLLTFGGGILVTTGYLEPEHVETITKTFDQVAGPAMTVFGILWSLFATEKQA